MGDHGIAQAYHPCPCQAMAAAANKRAGLAEAVRYGNIEEGIFIDRPNRFIANVNIAGRIESVHVKNTGRCRELLVPGARVYLDRCDGKKRRTEYDLIAVKKGERLINMDSQAPNAVFRELAESGGFMPGLTYFRGEYRWGGSRIDFYAEAGARRMLIEVKGVTLECGGVVSFPDAPTERGVRHLNELIRAAGEGFECFAVFIVQMDNVKYMVPNDMTHPQFGCAMRAAQAAGVRILAYDCTVTEDGIAIKQPVPVKL